MQQEAHAHTPISRLTGKALAFFVNLNAHCMCVPSAHYMVAVNGQFTQVFGTSASSPVVAAFLTEINNQRKYIGKGPVGFINPAVSAFQCLHTTQLDAHKKTCRFTLKISLTRSMT